MPKNARDSTREIAGFLLLSVCLYFALQSLVVVTHEYAHSTAAWLLGYTPSPSSVIWGNPITLLGWDEGVPYDRLFPSSGHPAEAVIGGIPLFLHTVFVCVSLYLLQSPQLTKSKMWFYAIYWFVVVNFTELVAYIVMRPFAGSGDTGRFNEGLRLPPWVLFATGTVLLIFALSVLVRRVMPRFDQVIDGSRGKHRIVVWLTAFVMFLWGSGLRIMSLYPDRQWRWGLTGIVAFCGWILADRLRSPDPSLLSTSSS